MEKVCCGILEKLYETYRRPFYRPWILDGESEEFKLVVGDWLAQLFVLAPDESISDELAPSIKLTFCPFCGVRLVAEVEKGDDIE